MPARKLTLKMCREGARRFMSEVINQNRPWTADTVSFYMPERWRLSYLITEDAFYPVTIDNVARAMWRHGVFDFDIGDRVEGGHPDTEDYDTGRVVALDGGAAIVAWDSGVRTKTHMSELRCLN